MGVVSDHAVVVLLVLLVRDDDGTLVSATSHGGHAGLLGGGHLLHTLGSGVHEGLVLLALVFGSRARAGHCDEALTFLSSSGRLCNKKQQRTLSRFYLSQGSVQ